MQNIVIKSKWSPRLFAIVVFEDRINTLIMVIPSYNLTFDHDNDWVEMYTACILVCSDAQIWNLANISISARQK